MPDDDAAVPTGLRHHRFLATPLVATIATLDHAAYVASPEVVGVHSAGRWPVEGFTLSDNPGLVAQHEVTIEPVARSPSRSWTHTVRRRSAAST